VYHGVFDESRQSAPNINLALDHSGSRSAWLLLARNLTSAEASKAVASPCSRLSSQQRNTASPSTLLPTVLCKYCRVCVSCLVDNSCKWPISQHIHASTNMQTYLMQVQCTFTKRATTRTSQSITAERPDSPSPSLHVIARLI
jgi:hypothetical protein